MSIPSEEFYNWVQEVNKTKGVHITQNIVDLVNVTECPKGHTDKEELVVVETEINYDSLNKITFTVHYVCHLCGMKLYSSSKTVITEKHHLVKRDVIKIVDEILNGGT